MRVMNLRRLLVSVLTISVLFMGAQAFAQESVPTNVQASPDINNGLCAGANLNVTSSCQTGGLSDAQANAKINRLIHEIINLFSVVVGVVSIIMIIVGGLKYITSGGDSTNVTGAKNTILYAVIGLVIVSLAQVIVRFVLAKVSQ